MLNTTTMIDAATVLAAIDAKATVVAARIRVVASVLKKRLAFWLFSKHHQGQHPQTPPYYSDYLCYAVCPSVRLLWVNGSNQEQGIGQFGQFSSSCR